jgi:hypothetical protein
MKAGTTCLGKMEATDLEENPEEIMYEVEHEDVPKEDDTFKPVKALKKWLRRWHLAPVLCGKMKEWTQGNGGSRRKLVATHRGMICHAGAARCKRHCCQGHSMDTAGQGSLK